MYKIIATQDFIDMLKDLPIRHLSVLTKSFISIEKMNDEDINLQDQSFMEDLLSQLRNQELE